MLRRPAGRAAPDLGGAAQLGAAAERLLPPHAAARAVDGDRSVGDGRGRRLDRDNEHLADLEVTVLPGQPPARDRPRAARRGGSAARGPTGRTTVCGEVLRRRRGRRRRTPRRTPSRRRWASTTVHLEDHLVLRLPGRRRPSRRSCARRSPAARSTYDVVTWGDRCPDEYVAGYCAMKTQMSNDVPIGEIDYEPIVYDEARLRTSEERTARSHHQLVAAARRAPTARSAATRSCTCRTARPTCSRTTPWSCPSTAATGSARSSSWPPSTCCSATTPTATSVHTWTDPENHAMYRDEPRASASPSSSGCTRCSARTAEWAGTPTSGGDCRRGPPSGGARSSRATCALGGGDGRVRCSEMELTKLRPWATRVAGARPRPGGSTPSRTATSRSTRRRCSADLVERRAAPRRPGRGARPGPRSAAHRRPGAGPRRASASADLGAWRRTVVAGAELQRELMAYADRLAALGLTAIAPARCPGVRRAPPGRPRRTPADRPAPAVGGPRGGSSRDAADGPRLGRRGGRARAPGHAEPQRPARAERLRGRRRAALLRLRRRDAHRAARRTPRPAQAARRPALPPGPTTAACGGSPTPRSRCGATSSRWRRCVAHCPPPCRLGLLPRLEVWVRCSVSMSDAELAEWGSWMTRTLDELLQDPPVGRRAS